MAISAEQLNIILSAKDKEFTRAMDRSQKRVERFAKSSNKSLGSASKAFGKMGAAAAALLPALSAAALVASVKRVVSSMDDIGKTADQIGITTDALQELRTVAESSGVTQDELDKSIEKLGKGLAEASMGIGTAQYALDELNLSAGELMSLGLEDALGTIADEINKVEDPMKKTALATQLFGRSGAPMINLLREGSDGMAEMRKEARELGVVIDEDLIRKAEAAQDKLDLMSRVISAQLSTALVELAPLLVSAAEGFAHLVKDFGTFFRVMNNGMGYSDEFVIDLIKQAQGAKGLKQELLDLQAAQTKLNTEGLEGRPHMTPDLVNAYDDAVKALQDALDAPQEALDLQAATAEKVRLLALAALSSATAEVEAARESARLKQIGAVAAEKERISREKQALMDKILSPYSGTGFTTEAVAARSEAERLGEEFEAAAIAASSILNPVKKIGPAISDTRTELQKMIDQMLEASPALVELGFDAEKLQSVMQTVEGSMESAFMSMIDGTMSAKDAFRSMAGDIIKELYRVLVVQKLVGMVSGAIGNAFGAPSMGGSGRASGGAVQAGQPYVTGEHGRELFVPSSAGRVLSVSQSKAAVGGGGDGVTVNQTINVSTGVQQTVRAEIKSLMPQIADSAKAAVVDAKRRGGSYGRSFS